MRSGGSNAKGGSFERWVCRRLTWMVTGKEQPEIFWRSATSGAKATQDRKKGVSSTMGGDIVAIHPLGAKFINLHCVECKNRKSMGSLDNLLTESGPLWDWWDRAVRDAEASSREPLLVFRANRTQTYIWVPFYTLTALPKRTLLLTERAGDEVGWLCSFEEWIKKNRGYCYLKLREIV